MSIELSTRTVHIHVGHNIPGYLPESDVMCFDSVDDALDALRHEIKDQQDFYYEGCEAETPEQQEKGSECCGWCDAAGDCETALGAIADGDTKYHFLINCYTGIQFTPPEGADILHWMTEHRDDREDCEIFADQGE